MTPWNGLKKRLRELADDSESGQAMTEFVLVFPIQLLLTLAIIQFAYIAYAHLVVAQAAFMGARAAAVADGMDGHTADEAAERVVARTCAVLASGDEPATDAKRNRPNEIDGQLRWRGPGDLYGFDENRQWEAYEHLRVNATYHEAYVACEVRYDYVLWIPVANQLFSDANSGFFFGGGDPAWTDATLERQRPVFRVHRVGFCATPWTDPDRNGDDAGAIRPVTADEVAVGPDDEPEPEEDD